MLDRVRDIANFSDVAIVFSKGSFPVRVVFVLNFLKLLSDLAESVVETLVRQVCQMLEVLLMTPQCELVLVFAISNPLEQTVNDGITSIELFGVIRSDFINLALLLLIL